MAHGFFHAAFQTAQVSAEGLFLELLSAVIESRRPDAKDKPEARKDKMVKRLMHFLKKKN